MNLSTKANCLLIGFLLTVTSLIGQDSVIPLNGNWTVAGVFNKVDKTNDNAIPSINTTGVEFWKSHAGADANTGKLTSPEFNTPQILGLYLSGSPAFENCKVYLKRRKDGAIYPLNIAGKDHLLKFERHFWKLPKSWTNVSVNLITEDNESGFAGWIGVSSPFKIPVTNSGKIGQTTTDNLIGKTALFLDNHYQTYYYFSAFLFLLLGILIFVEVKSIYYRLLAFLGIALIRLPGILFGHEFSLDEGLMISQAITLTENPLFWKSVDGTTGGPLLSYLLLIPHFLGFEIHYLSARIVGIILVILAGNFLFLGVKEIGEINAAKIALFVFFSFTAFITNNEFVHYSSEHLPLLLIGLNFFWMTKCFKNPDNFWYYFSFGILVLIFFLSKIQSIPVAFGLYVWLAIVLFVKRGFIFLIRKSLIILAGLLTALFPFLTALLLLGIMDDFYWFYIYNNFFIYIPKETATFDLIIDWYEHLQSYTTLRREFTVIFSTPFWISIPFLVFSLVFTGKRISNPWNILGASILLGLALSCVLPPGRVFPHYLMLSVLPSCILIGILFFEISNLYNGYKYKKIILIVLSLLVVQNIGKNIFDWNAKQGIWFNNYWLGRGIFSSNEWRYQEWVLAPEHQFIRKNAREGDSMIVWGFNYQYHVYNQMPQGSRFGQSYYIVDKAIPKDLQKKYCHKFFEDLTSNRPKILVDFKKTAFQDLNFELAISKEIFDYIAANYSKQLIGSANIYVRK